MLGKLLKYENKALSKTLFPLSLGVIVLSILTTVMMKLNFYFNDSIVSSNNFLSVIFNSITIIFSIVCIISIISSIFIAIVLILQRYYKNLFSDEGYLTFTLPVKTGDIILSKLFAAVIWSIIIIISALIGGSIFAVFGTSKSLINYDVINGFTHIIKTIWNIDALNIGIKFSDVIILSCEMLISSIISLFTGILLFYLAITLGNQVAKKHKIFASVGMYFVITAIVNIVESILLFLLTDISELNNYTGIIYFYQTLLIGLALSLVTGIIYFFINKHILQTRLNID